MAKRSGYEAEVVIAFLYSQGEAREDGQLIYINNIRAPEATREMLRRWRTWEHISLDKVDALLMRYDLMLFELEDWARSAFGRDGFFDPLAEPANLAV